MADHRMPRPAVPTADLVLVLRHEQDAGPANLAAWLDRRQIPWTLIDVRADRLPEPARHRALVVLGSDESAYDDSVPWIPAEREYVRAVIALGTPVLGLCFGGQLLAQVLGGRVRRAAVPERGWIPVTASAPWSATADAVAGCWFTWHDDEIVLPPTAVRLAHGSCVQAFGHGPHLGVQFHPEVTEAEVRSWMRAAHLQGYAAGATGAAAREMPGPAARFRDAELAAGALYARFFGAAR